MIFLVVYYNNKSITIFRISILQEKKIWIASFFFYTVAEIMESTWRLMTTVIFFLVQSNILHAHREHKVRINDETGMFCLTSLNISIERLIIRFRSTIQYSIQTSTVGAKRRLSSRQSRGLNAHPKSSTTTCALELVSLTWYPTASRPLLVI